MTLGQAISISKEGMFVAQRKTSIAAENISNSEQPGYARQDALTQTLVSGNFGQGIRLNGVQENIDIALQASIRTQTSDYGRTQSTKLFTEKIEQLYGDPSTGNNLNSFIEDFFNNFQVLADNPNSPTMQINAVNSADSLATKISTIADGLHTLQLEIDREISASVTQINGLLNSLAETNKLVGDTQENTTASNKIEQDRRVALQKLSEYLNINTSIDSNNILSITAGTGAALLDANSYNLAYSPAGSKNVFVDDTALAAIYVRELDSTGSVITGTDDETLATAGTLDNRSTSLNNGSIKSLIDIRDTLIPDLLAQLDELAYQLTENVNTIHNDGSSFPAPSSLTGTRSVTTTDSVGFSGSVMIAVVNSDGSPVNSPYDDETYYKPLTLDLSSLNSGEGLGNGKPTMQTIVDEINNHFGPSTSRASVGDIQNINLAVVSADNNIQTGETFTLDFELDSISGTNSTFEVTGISLDNGGALSGSLPSSYTLTAGTKGRTNDSFTIDLSAGTGGPYTLTASVQVTEADGTVTTADITYTINADNTEDINDRFHSTAVTQTSTLGSVNFQTAPSSARFATAQIIDIDGDIASPGEAGFLQITTPTGQSYGIAINELNSQEVGLATTAAVDVTNSSFSQYFGLNDFFVANREVSGSAYNMAVRSDIVATPNIVAVGELTQMPDDTLGNPRYSYEITAGNVALAERVVNLGISGTNFSIAGSQAARTSSFGSYSASLTEFIAIKTNNASTDFGLTESVLESSQQLFKETSGVDIDKELADLQETENFFRSLATLLNIANSMLDVLNDVFR